MDSAIEACAASTVRKSRRTAAKPSSRLPVRKVKATHCISVEAQERLGVHAALLHVDRSELVERLILDGLKEFTFSRWRGRSESTLPVSEDRPFDTAA
jgi:hypothetical protein